MTEPRRETRRDPSGGRTGWTTGTCAAAAAKASAQCLATGTAPDRVEIGLPTGDRVRFSPHWCRRGPLGRSAEAAVLKDAGDDPDVTHGALLVVRTTWSEEPGVAVEGGSGVGVVTLPGLGLPVGGAAINPTPRAMIVVAVSEALAEAGVPDRGTLAVVRVPGGRRLARRTLNSRLGIVGGISILGTTGVVRPLSTEAWRVSVERAVGVASASGGPVMALCTGGRTLHAARALCPDLPPQSFVEVGDFTGDALTRAVATGARRVVFVGMIGKLTKLASGALLTHADQCAMDLTVLAEITVAAGGLGELVERVASARTARRAYELWEEAGLLSACASRLCSRAARAMLAHAAHPGDQVDIEIEAVLVDFSGTRTIMRVRAGGDAR